MKKLPQYSGNDALSQKAASKINRDFWRTYPPIWPPEGNWLKPETRNGSAHF